jgi:hypothetical protein
MMLERFVPSQALTTNYYCATFKSCSIGQQSEALQSKAQATAGIYTYAMARPRLPPKQANGVLSPWNRQRSVAGERDPSWRRSKQLRRDSRPSRLRSLLIVLIIVRAVTGLIVCDDVSSAVDFSGGTGKGVEVIMDLLKNPSSKPDYETVQAVSHPPRSGSTGKSSGTFTRTYMHIHTGRQVLQFPTSEPSPSLVARSQLSQTAPGLLFFAHLSVVFPNSAIP